MSTKTGPFEILNRMHEDHARELSEQWAPVADARERQEKRLRPDESTSSVLHDDLEPYLWRDRRRRVNDEQWMHDSESPPESPPPKRDPAHAAWFWLVVVTSVILLWSLYVLSCGLVPWGGCSR